MHPSGKRDRAVAGHDRHTEIEMSVIETCDEFLIGLLVYRERPDLIRRIGTFMRKTEWRHKYLTQLQ